MINLETTFAGLTLKNPIIVSSSGLTSTPEKNKYLADAGVGAIVLKSLYEEQIALELGQMHTAAGYYPEGGEYLEAAVRNTQVTEYLQLIRETKNSCHIPIIASINCYNDDEWVACANAVEAAGADALEINILALQTAKDYSYGSFEQQHIDILQKIRQHTRIPIIMKLGRNLTNPVSLINQLYAGGAQGVVLFNRSYQPDINVETLEVTQRAAIFTTPALLSESLRWVGISSATISGIDYAVSGGVHSGEDVVKSILAGANAVEMCSAIYQNGGEYVCYILQFVSEWMIKHGMKRISDFRAMLNMKDPAAATVYERMQFMRYYDKYE
ncbi:MAG: dihydroorotate dehydrogenase-like protein [Prevotellaceae bacterium]|jgi:dihydroorotate dehydrogenase (fumarate)|nr:dihydroorotate dehydrogenase-like protein [Prevotellaceae bacterium]